MSISANGLVGPGHSRPWLAFCQLDCDRKVVSVLIPIFRQGLLRESKGLAAFCEIVADSLAKFAGVGTLDGRLECRHCRPGGPTSAYPILVWRYFSSSRCGFFSASRRNGIAQLHRAHDLDHRGLALLSALRTPRQAPRPQPSSLSTVTPSAPSERAMAAKLGFSRFTPRKRVS